MLHSIVRATSALSEQNPTMYTCMRVCNNTIRRTKEWRRVKSWLNEPDTKPEARGAQETDARDSNPGNRHKGPFLRKSFTRAREAKLLQGRHTRYRGMIAVLNSGKSSPRNGNWSGVPETMFLTKRGVSARNRRAATTPPLLPRIYTFYIQSKMEPSQCRK